MRTFLLASLIVLSSAPAARAQQEAARLITPAELAKAIDDPNLVLLHVGDRAEYNAEHLPGARFVSLQDVSVMEGGLVLQMPDDDALRDRLEALGISDNSKVVVYFGRDWVSPSTRVMFTLAHAGLADVALLDGGMGAWKKAGHQTTDAAPAAARGTLSTLKPRDDIADAAYLQANIGKPGFVLIDARDPAFYEGTREGGPRDKRMAGHITGAVSIPFTSTASDDLTLKPRADLQALFSKAGVKPGDTIVTYCHIGQQATVVLFAARTLGHKVLLYDGSFEDWVRRGLPVTNPAAR